MRQPLHTPGPWFASACDNNIEADVRDSENYFIAVCMGGAGIDGAENALANAALVAAAPELLSALQKAEAFMSGFEGDDLQEGIDEQLAEIRAAIVKATEAGDA